MDFFKKLRSGSFSKSQSEKPDFLTRRTSRSSSNHNEHKDSAIDDHAEGAENKDYEDFLKRARREDARLKEMEKMRKSATMSPWAGRM